MYLIAGLGNPGKAYRETRHNVGYMVVDRLANGLGSRLKGRRFKSRRARVKLQGEDVLLIRPQAYMNLSGWPIRSFVDHYGLAIESVLVVHDDLDLPLGRIRVAKKGGDGGHRGMLSVIEYLGSTQVPRVRIGIGRPRHGESVQEYVLTPFYTEQINVVDKVIRGAVTACGLFVKEGVESAMNIINCQNFADKEEII